MRSTYRHDSFSDWGCGVKLAVWICSVIGPLMVVGGVVFLVLAVRDPAATAVKSFNRNVQLWTEVGGGFIIFQEAFMGPEFPVQVLPAAGNSTAEGQNVEVLLQSSTGVNLLANQGDGYATYQESLFFAGNLPIFGDGDGPDWIVQPTYEQSTQIPITSYTCQSVTLTLPCAEVSPPPPPSKPPPPPALTAYFLTNTTLGVNPYLLGLKSATRFSPPPPPPPIGSSDVAAEADMEPVVDQVALPPSYTANIARKLLVSSSDAAAAPAAAPSNGMCTVYYRTINFLTELTITASEPQSCGGGYCDNNTWVYALAPTCAETYKTVNVPITAATYSADMADGASWCSTWWETVPSFEVPASTMYLRSSTDPYILAGEMTNCSFAFDQASEEYANAGFFFLVPGLAISLVAYFCLEGVCTPRSMGASGPSSAPLLPKDPPMGALPPYGTTTAVELIGRGMIPASSWGGGKQA